MHSPVELAGWGHEDAVKRPGTRCGQESRRDSGALEAGEDRLEEEGTAVCAAGTT